jgi:hypothetical protein
VVHGFGASARSSRGGAVQRGGILGEKGFGAKPSLHTRAAYSCHEPGKAGEPDKAAEVIQQVLAIEPGLTIAKMRPRLDFFPEGAWNKHAEALRLAGLPE